MLLVIFWKEWVIHTNFNPINNYKISINNMCDYISVHYIYIYVLHYIYMLAQSLSCVQHFATLWTVAHQAPLSMEFSRQEYWSGLPFLPPGDLLDPGIKPVSSASLDSLALVGRTFITEPHGKPTYMYIYSESYSYTFMSE